MDFRSDNTAAVHPNLISRLAVINSENSGSYGSDEESKKLKNKLSDLFGCDLLFALVSTGTAANCVALRTLCPSYGTVLTSQESHLNNDEGQAPELFLAGGKLRTFSTSDKKFDLVAAQHWVDKATKMTPHAAKPSCVSITYATEWGDLYSVQELRDLKSFCDHNKLFLHVDGARFANGLVANQLSAKEFVSILKPDALSFGLTKNGALQAEMIVLFNLDFKDHFYFIHKQAAQLMSKTRFISAQILALLEKDLWLDLAIHANEKASQLKESLKDHHSFKIVNSAKTNQLFVQMNEKTKHVLEKQGCLFYHWQDDIYRFVTSWMTSDDEIKAFEKMTRALASS